MDRDRKKKVSIALDVHYVSIDEQLDMQQLLRRSAVLTGEVHEIAHTHVAADHVLQYQTL